MEVILIENVDKLGGRGQIVKVAAGYGRNHLLPKKLAVLATSQNRKWAQQQRQRFLKQEAKERGEAEELAKLVNDVRLVFTRKSGEHGTLFGSVTAIDIAGSLSGQGYNLDRKKIHLPNPLKTIGEHQVPVRLHREVTAAINVVIEAEEGAAGSAAPEPQPPAQTASTKEPAR